MAINIDFSEGRNERQKELEIVKDMIYGMLNEHDINLTFEKKGTFVKMFLSSKNKNEKVEVELGTIKL